MMPGTDDERELVEAAQQDPRRFGELYERNFERVYAFVARRVHDRHETEDITAEVFHHALANLAKFEWRGVPFAVWLYRIAANVIADRWKQLSRHDADSTADDLDQSHWPDLERRAILFQLVDNLPADQRSVVLKRFVEQKSIREIAQEFARSQGAIKQLQYRALETLRALAGGRHE
jgi:RNA polymerase sigma-70 factor (ECF subfamily)